LKNKIKPAKGWFYLSSTIFYSMFRFDDMIKPDTTNFKTTGDVFMKKIIISKGDAYTPERFWERAVCSEEEFTDTLKESGWVKSTCTKYLSTTQLAYLNEGAS
jgi:hypothetical protein